MCFESRAGKRGYVACDELRRIGRQSRDSVGEYRSEVGEVTEGSAECDGARIERDRHVSDRQPES